MIFQPLAQQLIHYVPYDEHEALSVLQLKQFLAESQNPYDRSNLIAHTIVDAWVLSPDRSQVLLLVNAASGLWGTPGGHTDGNPNMWEESIRELTEETGLTKNHIKPLLNGNIFDINTGTIPARQKPHGIEPPHLHFDICFAFEASPTTPLTISAESNALQWKPVSEALNIMMDCHHRRAHKTLAGLLPA